MKSLGSMSEESRRNAMKNLIIQWDSFNDMPEDMQRKFLHAGGWCDDIDWIKFVPSHLIEDVENSFEFKLNRHGPPVKFEVQHGAFFVDFHA
jgi:hypothetical protein